MGASGVFALVVDRKHHQRKLQVMTTMGASGVFALVGDRKTPLVQVAEGTSKSRMQQPNAACTRARSGFKAVPLCKVIVMYYPMMIYISTLDANERQARELHMVRKRRV